MLRSNFTIAMVSLFVGHLFQLDLTHAQNSDISEPSIYVAKGLSISNTDTYTFAERSYPSAEIGLNFGDLSLALVTGRSDNDFKGEESISDYWWEIKTALMFPVGSFDAYGVLGIGNYVSTDQIFIEYGVGFSKSWDQFSWFAQVSNWDNLWYITPGFAYSFE